MKKRHHILRILLVVLSLCVVSCLTYVVVSDQKWFFQKDNKGTENSNQDNGKKDDKKDEPKKEEDPPTPPAPKLKIINLDSKTRPIGIMIDNEKGAWPQAGLQEAFLTYEIIVEGGVTRFLALYKDSTTAMIGPDRSARHYFLDYAMENDAIFVHFGFSPQARADINSFGINNISGTQGDGSAFWREKVITTSWQNAFTSISNLTNRAIAKKYRMESDAKPLLNYSVAELDLSTIAGVKAANKVIIPYSKLYSASYQYDPTTKLYKRYINGTPHTDRVNGLQYTAKNIIVYSVKNYPLNDEPGKGRQGIENIGSGTGYYITDGYAMPINWAKSSRASRTVYTDSSGTEIKVNDGNTFIHLQPTSQILTLE